MPQIPGVITSYSFFGLIILGQGFYLDPQFLPNRLMLEKAENFFTSLSHTGASKTFLPSSTSALNTVQPYKLDNSPSFDYRDNLILALNFL